MVRFICLLFTASLPVFAFAQDRTRHEELALKVYELSDDEDAMAEAARQTFAPFLDQMRSQGVSEKKLKQISVAFDRFMEKVATDPELKERMVELHVKMYTEEELEELLKFFKTPIGQKLIETMPELMSESMQLGQELALKHQADFATEVQRIMSKP